MIRIRNLPIRFKLTALTAITTTLALAVCCVLFVVNDIRLMRRSKVDQLTAIAEILAQNSSAALSFRQQDSAIELLESLSDRRTIVAAWMLDDASDEFARYSRLPDAKCPSFRADQEYRYASDGSLFAWSPIVESGEVLGTIVVQDSLEDLHANIEDSIVITVFVLLIGTSIGLSVALPLNHVLSRPILELATAAQQISLGADFDLRVKHESQDEIGVLYDEFNAMLTRIQERDGVIRRAHGELQQSNDLLENRVHMRTQMLELANQKLKREMLQSELASAALTDAQDELIESSRKAGMADVANSVLHNVGNVLNSLNVSAAVITERVREMRVVKLQQCISMILNHQGDLTDFLRHDAKGSIIPGYLPNLVDHLTGDQQRVLCELESLTKNVEHIKDIVRAQQSHAGAFGVVEMCKPRDLIEDAVQFSLDSIKRHGIDLVRDYEDVGEVQVETARLLQILVNLIKNAKESVLAVEGTDKRITLAIRNKGERVQYVVSDSGAGIDPEQLTKIFSHGFTTKANGHGFGLHASANFAKEMGGELTALSAGVGRGATFVIELPKTRESTRASQAAVAGHSLTTSQ
jgi:signal transduction histidine kinase